MTRIITGSARGRKIKVPEHGTRPTSDRAREGLFSSLEARFGVAEQRVLDLFSGSGALGLEAASRGAEHVVLVENAPGPAAVIRKNIETLGFNHVELVELKVSSYLPQAPAGYFTMVLADPPYELSDAAVLELLHALPRVLAPGAVVVVERHVDSPETDWPEGYEKTPQKLKKRTYGIARMDMAVWEGQ